jgi:dipeptidyl-peptidase 4
VAADGRGTPGRGHDWERAISGRLADVPLNEQVAALQSLGAQFPELDLNRVGVSGWSFGGYFSALAVLRRPDIFKAAIAGAPVTDWLDYDTCYTERYLGIPPEADAVYRQNSLVDDAKNLTRPLLLIHGLTDDNVFCRHSLKLADALFRAGKDFEFLPLSGFTHMVPDPVVRERLERRMIDFLHKHLGEPK